MEHPRTHDPDELQRRDEARRTRRGGPRDEPAEGQRAERRIDCEAEPPGEPQPVARAGRHSPRRPES